VERPRRYKRRAAGGRGGYRRYLRRWALVRVDFVDDIVSPNLERALRRGSVRKVLGRYGDISLIIKTIKQGRTEVVMHIVVNRQAVVRHMGIKGVRGWDPLNPSKVSLPKEWIVEGRKG
jgi:hypothetical protein